MKGLSCKLVLGITVLVGISGSGVGWAKETADDAVFSFTKVGLSGLEAFARLQDAHKAVVSNPAIQKFLQNNLVHSLSMTALVSDPEIETTKFQHFFKGIEVFGAKAFHHRVNGQSEVISEMVEFDLDTNPKLSAEQAAAVARSVLPGADRNLDGAPELKIFPSMEEHTARLIYWVGFTSNELSAGHDILVDANSGEVISVMSRNIELAPVNVITTRINGVDLEGCQKLDSQGRPNEVNLAKCKVVVSNGRVAQNADQSARQAAANSKAVATYFQRKHGRNSYDGRGAALTSLVHVGKKFDNAFWSSELKIMAYGDGDGVEFGDFTRALDVAGHEMTHGMTSETAKLIYMDQSGALNEAFSDFFGKMIANDSDWVIGKKIFLKPGSKGIRNLATPGVHSACAERDFLGRCSKQLPYPAHVNQMFPKQASCGAMNDNCWVHINATVPGHAMYLVAQAITKAKAERLFYLVLTHFMSESSNFNNFSTASVRACARLFDTMTCSLVKKSFQQVGL